LNGRRDTVRRDERLASRLVFSYAGSSERYQLPDRMCRLFRRVHERFPHAFFLILSHDRDAFLRCLAAEGVAPDSYRVQGVERSEVFGWLQAADIGVVMRDDSIVNRVASPTKFAEYCASGLPVITTLGLGDVSDAVDRHQLGFIVDIDALDVDARLSAFIEDVEQNRAAYRDRCSAWARECMSWTAFGSVVTGIYAEITAGSRS
jgi:hypothetical protein